MSPNEPWLLVPEFIALFVGMFACWGTTFFYVLWNARKSRRTQLLCIHRNLQKINLAWSTNEAAIKPAAEVNFKNETLSEHKWFLIAGGVLSFASWLGFLILSVLIISLEYLAKPRLEKAIFQSPLATDPSLTVADVQKLVSEIDQK